MSPLNYHALIREVPDFPKPGILFYDITTLLKDARALSSIADELTVHYQGHRIAKVIGIESRGFIFGGILADRLNAGFVLVRKPGKLPADSFEVKYSLEYGSNSLAIHRDAIGTGERVLIVDDLLATGGTAAATVSLVQQLGGEIAGLDFLVELQNLKGREKLSGHPIHSTIVYPSSLASSSSTTPCQRREWRAMNATLFWVYSDVYPGVVFAMATKTHAKKKPVAKAKAQTPLAKSASKPKRAPDVILPKPISMAVSPLAARPKESAKEREDRERRRQVLHQMLMRKRQEIIKEIEGSLGQSLIEDKQRRLESARDVGDQALMDLDRELGISLMEMRNRRRQAIDEALTRLNEGTYGICAECGVEISERRLEAVPFAKLCVECQSKEELLEKIEREEDRD